MANRKPRQFKRTQLDAESAMHLWLSRIIDDLNPDDFSITELIDEFGAEIFSPKHEGYYNDEGYLRGQIAKLLKHEYIEKIAKGRYQVTDAGRAFRDSFVHEG